MWSYMSKFSSRPSSASSSQSPVVGKAAPPRTADDQTGQLSSSPMTTHPLPFGKAVLAEFQHDPAYHNLNHGSFGTVPSYITSRLRHYQALAERAPDPFIRYTYPSLLDANRAALATLLNAPDVNEVVLVPNATTGVNTVLRALAETSPADGLDEILYFSTIYGACGKTVAYVSDTSHGLITGRAISLTYPVSDASILAKFHAAITASRAEGKRPRVAIFDAVSSLPGARVPFAALVAACRERGMLSLVDGAQGVGMVDLDLTALDPDFFVSNCHKWLFVPRGCAVLYVPVRNQHLVPSTVPTSHGYVPREPAARIKNPLPPNPHKPPFVSSFEYVGTLDNSPYLCVRDAIEWREKVLGGEERIRAYVTGLARTGGEEVARALGTWVMRNEEGTLGDCGMVNVTLPFAIVPQAGTEAQKGGNEDGTVREVDVEEAAPVHALGTGVEGQVPGEGKSAVAESPRQGQGDTVIPYDDVKRIWAWMEKVLVDEYNTFIPTYYLDGRFWARLSAQVYLDGDDFVWAGQTLKRVCERVANKEYDL